MASVNDADGSSRLQLISADRAAEIASPADEAKRAKAALRARFRAQDQKIYARRKQHGNDIDADSRV